MLTFGAEIPFVDHCGIEPLDFDGTRTRLRVTIGPEHLNNLGIAHGGLLCTILDVAMGTVARSIVGVPVMTLDMQTSFLSPGRGVLIAQGRVLRAGRSIVFCEADLRDEAGELVARSSGTFRAVRRSGPDAGA